MTVLTGENAVGLETVTEMRRQWHKVHACLVETAIYNLEEDVSVTMARGGWPLTL